MGPRDRRTELPGKNATQLSKLKKIIPYIWEYRGRVLFALMALIISKLALVALPVILKHIVDALDTSKHDILTLPLALLIAYGLLRLLASAFNELRDVIFSRVRYRAMRRLSTEVLEKLYALSLGFHLDRKTGNITQDLNRGSQSVSSILNFLVFNIIPTIAEFILVAVILLSAYPPVFAVITFTAVAIYVSFTLIITNWRISYRLEMNSLESEANGRAIDGLINYETVKSYTNEKLELGKYDSTLSEWEKAAIKSQSTMSLLNFGQGSIIAIGVTLILYFAVKGVTEQQLSLGDLVLINTMMLQLFLPLGFLGIIYRSLRYAIADMSNVFALLEREIEINDTPDANELVISKAEIKFDNICFNYTSERTIIDGISFTIPSGKKVAIVGPSGSGKSTLVKLLFRFFDVDSGQVLIDSQNITEVTQDSLRKVIGIVPQDTLLFNDTIAQNLRYAKPDATDEEIYNAAKVADIHHFIESLPEKYQTIVGERGLKLSGGEKQRVAIARVVLKNPPIMVFDEATSSLDTHSETNILKALKAISKNTTTLVIAHRLSTIIDADNILVMQNGKIVESGNHEALLQQNGKYADMWQSQKTNSNQ